jgi:DNA-binding beta-propeller fold protein YncE
LAGKDGAMGRYVGGIAVDARDNVYTAGWGDTIAKFDSTGKYITAIGSSGSGDGQFKTPMGLVVDSNGMLYVADTGNNRISKLDGNGKFVSKITRCGSDTSVKFVPVDIALDAAGNMYVTDVGSVGVCKYDSNGKFMSRWGSAGTGDGQFYRSDPLNEYRSPWGIAVDRQGNIYVSDYGNHRIVKFAPR